MHEKYDKSKEILYNNYWDVNNLYGWEISQKSPVGSFRWVENTSQSSNDLIKDCNVDCDE